MFLPTTVNPFLVATFLLEPGVCILALKRRIGQVLPFFTSYVIAVLGVDISYELVYHFSGYTSRFSANFYWLMQALLIALRGLVAASLCWSLLRQSAGVWKMARHLLLLVAAILLVSAGLAARHSHTVGFAMVAETEKRLEICILGLLIIGLAFCKYFRVPVPNFIAWIALGLGFYSAVQVANSSIWSQWLLSYFGWWSLLRTTSFNVATLFWIIALRNPIQAFEQRPHPLGRERYEVLAPQMSLRLRNLNARLEEMLR